MDGGAIDRGINNLLACFGCLIFIVAGAALALGYWWGAS